VLKMPLDHGRATTPESVGPPTSPGLRQQAATPSFGTRCFRFRTFFAVGAVLPDRMPIMPRSK
jgi:hypothetical protein